MQRPDGGGKVFTPFPSNGRQPPAVSRNPVLVEVTRGRAPGHDHVESAHRGAAAVVDSSGRLVAAWGEIDRSVFPRSAVKPLQALPLIETGAADALAVTETEIALACASHGGEPEHVAAVGAWLARMGMGPDALECGGHSPLHEASALAMACAGEWPTAVHNNCSGKHAGMLATAVHLGEPVTGYVEAGHPVQMRVRAALQDMCGADLSAAPVGIDGCSIPTFAMPVVALARAMARFADPDAAGLPATRAAACRRVQTAMAAHPFYVAGTGRCCTAVIEATGGAVLVKTGAEGVYCAAIPASGLGLALKIDDGAKRASEVALVALLDHLAVLDRAQASALSVFARPAIPSRSGASIGEIRPAAGWP